MPKRLEEINVFSAGTVYTPDDRDLPNSAASYSLNVDPLLDNGSIKSIPDDTTQRAGVDSLGMSLINDDGTIRAVYMDSDGDIFKVDDLEGTPGTPTSLESGTYTSIPAMEVNNKEAHIGLGTSRDPKWVGIIPHKQFDGSVPSGLQIQDAELKPPSSFPFIHKVVSDASYTYCIELDGNYVYKFDNSAGVLLKRSTYYFTDTRAMCMGSDGKLWVVDKISASLVSIIKIDTDEMDVVISVSTNNFTNDTNVTDCIEIDSYLWMTANVEVSSGSGQFVWNVTTASLVTGATVTMTDRTPFLGASSGTPGHGDWSNGSGAETEPIFNVPKVALMIPTDNAGHIGIIVHANLEGSTDGAPVTFHKSSGSIIKQWYLLLVHNSITAGSKLTGAVSTGKVFGFTEDYGDKTKVSCSRAHASSTYYTVGFEAGANTTTFGRVTKPDYDSANGSLIGSHTVIDGSDRSLDQAQFDEIGARYNIFSGASHQRWASSTASSVSAVLESQVGLSFTDNTAITGTLAGSTAFFYTTSLLYDGYQESPLAPWTKNDVSGMNALDVTISVYPNGLSSRVTHINLYRSSASGASSTEPTGFFRLVKTISIKTGFLTTDSSTTNPDWGNYYTKTILDTGSVGASYEAKTGIPEVLNNFTPKYTLSTSLNNHLYVANCSHIDIDDASLYLFKSRPFNYDQFNWVFDSLLLPEIPTAIKGFNGRVYAFTKSKIYRIEPNGMYIEDIFDGAGCLNSKTVIVTDYGMFFADDNNIYFHNGSTPRPIANQILTQSDVDVENAPTSSYTAWQLRSSPQKDVIMGFDNKRRALLVFFDIQYSYSGTQNRYYCWAYSLDSQRWDLWEAPAVTSYVSGTSGENFISNGTDLFSYLGHTSNKRAWKWYSKKMVMNASTVDKKFIKMHEQSDAGTPTVTVAFDTGATSYSALSAITKAKWVRVKAVSASNTDRLNAIGIQWRRLREAPITNP